ncbi:hypothetical protein [Ureibacillus acetophenoni]|uniref:Uncharacterized protein n=1 Tax=Ureibacillus acetophenoni TaxID=614649 RepID=A0A285UIL5_9BACL|nr:hypothetical protein [Ureibacillus acetophenoni]SOC41537.1 hypothetical protein SAMN05877842_110148 [Ureibacillus acetophenoni]
MKEKLHNEKSRKRKYIFYSVIGIAILAVGVTLLSMNLLKTNEHVESGEIDQVADTQDSQQVEESQNFRMFDDRTVKITKYEMFHRTPAFYSLEEVEYFSLSDTIEKYALFHHLDKHGYEMDEARRDRMREWVRGTFEYDKKDPALNDYFNKMFHVLRITEEDYIEHYLLVNKEYELLENDMYDKRIGLDEDGGYYFMDAKMDYLELAGISQLQLMKLSERIPERLEPMDPQPELPYLAEDSYLQVTKNEEGDYIFTNPSYISMRLGEQYEELWTELEYRIVKDVLTRFSLERYKAAVASYENDDPQKVEAAKELGEILEILDRSVDKKFY